MPTIALGSLGSILALIVLVVVVVALILALAGQALALSPVLFLVLLGALAVARLT